MNNTTNAPERLSCIRFVRRWGDTDYPGIAHLTPPFDLVAHPNGPAITDGDWISVLDIHPDDPEGQQAIKREAQEAWRKYSWPLLRANFYPPNQ
jgi:hypothetical protein